MTSRRSVLALAAGGVLVLVVNAVILGTAAYNRQGERLAELTLTERELELPEFREDENSGLVLTLVFASQSPSPIRRLERRRPDDLPAVTYPWLDRAKLESLGFRLRSSSSDPTDEHGEASAAGRPAFVALELDGDSWPRWLSDREESLRNHLTAADAEALLALDRTMRSRLVPIDAGNDAVDLRRRHPDRTRTLIVEGLIGAARVDTGDGTPAWRGQIVQLRVSEIRVPRELAPALEKFLPRETASATIERERKELRTDWPVPRPPRYRAVVAFGSRNEPWLVSVSEMPAD